MLHIYTQRQNIHVNKQIKPLSFKLWFHLQYNEIQYDVIVNVWITTLQCMSQRSLLASGNDSFTRDPVCFACPIAVQGHGYTSRDEVGVLFA